MASGPEGRSDPSTERGVQSAAWDIQAVAELFAAEHP
jgi:hypothetical protein